MADPYRASRQFERFLGGNLFSRLSVPDDRAVFSDLADLASRRAAEESRRPDTSEGEVLGHITYDFKEKTVRYDSFTPQSSSGTHNADRPSE